MAEARALPYEFKGDSTKVVFVPPTPEGAAAPSPMYCTLYGMFVELEKKGHVNFKLSMHEIQRKPDGEVGWKITGTQKVIDFFVAWTLV